MAFPNFLSSLIIASTAFIVLLFAVLTFLEKEYKSTLSGIFIICSIFLMTLNNILIVIAFYQSEPSMEFKYSLPLIFYILGMVAFILGGFYLMVGRYAKTIKPKLKN